MNKRKKNPKLLLVLGIILAVAGGIFLIAAPEVYLFGVFALVFGVLCVIMGLVQKSQTSTKNTYTVEATFTGIGKFEEMWVGCYFEVDGKQMRIAIFKNVYNPKLLMPGGKYRITRKNKDDTVVDVERID